MAFIEDIESGKIFENFTIQEISGKEKKIRQEIEKKKEELRQMVGERYRDLIEAADTISEMKSGTQKVSSSISKLQGLCLDLKKTAINFQKISSNKNFQRNNVNSLSSQKEAEYGFAINMKLLMEIPDRMWIELDKGCYLEAAQLYLLAAHMRNYNPTISEGVEGRGILYMRGRLIDFPLVSRQWINIENLKETIVMNAQNKLKETKLNDRNICECLCTMILLQEKSISYVFELFLEARSDYVCQLLKSYNTELSIKSLLSDVVMTMICTIKQIHAMFIVKSLEEEKENSSNSTSLLRKLLDSDSKVKLTEEMVMSILSPLELKHLPLNIKNHKNKIRAELLIFSQDVILEGANHFIEKCGQIIKSRIIEILAFVTNVKGLTAIRNEIYFILNKKMNPEEWKQVCMNVIGKRFDIWEDLLSQHFIDHMKDLMKTGLDQMVNSSKSLIVKILQDLNNPKNEFFANERDLSLYIWSENSNDIHPSAAWVPLGQKVSNAGQQQNFSLTSSKKAGLQMKAKAYTIAVQSLCQNMDVKLKQLSEGVTTYVEGTDTISGSTVSKRNPSLTLNKSSSFKIDSPYSRKLESASSIENETLEKFIDAKTIENVLRSLCLGSLNELADFIEEQLSILEMELSSAKPNELLLDLKGRGKEADDDDGTRSSIISNRTLIIDKILLLSRFSNAITDIVPCLKFCMLSSMKTDNQRSGINGCNLYQVNKTINSISSMSSTPGQNNQEELNQWKESVTKFSSFSDRALKIWSSEMEIRLMGEFKNSLYAMSQHQISAHLSTCTQWESITIEEEMDTGENVQSQIRVPMQTSSYVQRLLFDLCQEINRVGGYVIHSSVLVSLMKLLETDIIEQYLGMIEEAIGGGQFFQNRALQILFDFKFLISFLSPKLEERKKYDEVMEMLESKIDPFDMDVFRPHLMKNLNKQIQKSSVFYGLLNTSDRSTILNISSSLTTVSGTQQEQHYVSPLSINQHRFTLLPISSQTGNNINLGSNNPHSSKIGNMVTVNTQPSLHNKQASLGNEKNFFSKTPSTASYNNSNASTSSIASENRNGQAKKLPPRVSSSSFLEQMSSAWFNTQSSK